MAHVPFVVQCPEPVETANLHFKSLSKIQVFDADGVTYDSNTSLLAVSHSYGLTFIGTVNGFLIFKSKYIFTGNNNDQHRKEIVLNSRTTHLATDHEDNHLAVACQTKMGPILYIYNIPSFLTKGVSPIKTVPLSKPFQVSQLCELLWQPNSENGLTVCFTDGSVSSLSLFQGSGNDIFSLPPTTQARCLCWSPKGKQLVIGSSDGSLSQYKPDLKFVKKLSSPPLFNGAETVVNVLWISNFQFLAAYKDANKADHFPIIVIVNAPKNEPIRFINYDDITYSSTHFRAHQFYFHHMILWNLIFMASANSVEVAVLHAKEDNATWEQWLLGDASRAELPLNSQKSETFPLGMTFDYTRDQVIPWGEGFLPPMPVLLLLSSEGLLITFTVINASSNANKICFTSEKVFDDSWFGAKEKSIDEGITMSQPAEGTPSPGRTSEASKVEQMFPSTFASLNSVSLTPQENVTTSVVPLNLKSQPQKLQTVSPIQQQTQQMQFQVPVQLGGVSVFQNPNSPSKWSQKSPFSFSLPPNSGKAPETGNIALNKPNEIFKNVEQSGSMFVAKPSQRTQPSEAKDWLAKPQKPVETSIETKTGIPPSVVSVSDQSNSFSTPVSGEGKGTGTPETSPSRATPEVAVVDDSVYVAALWDEVDHFNAELKEVISRVSALRVRIGTEEEKEVLRDTVQKLNHFQNSLNETTASQKSEIRGIKSDVMEAFAWLEDARSRNRQRKSPTFIGLKKSQDLDPMSSRLMTEINHLQYYIENQLKQLHSYLMKEWMHHEDNCRLDIKATMAIPSMEQLYKTMNLELKILCKQRLVVEELRLRMKERNHKNRGDGSFVTIPSRNESETLDNNRVSELFKLADNLLQIKIDRDEEKTDICVTDAFQVMLKNQINAIAERSKKFTQEKQNILRDVLTEREMLKTRSVKATFASSSFIRNASSMLYSKPLLTSKRRKEEKVEIGRVEKSVEGKFFDKTEETTVKDGGVSVVPVYHSGNMVSPVKSPADAHKSSELFTFSVPKSTTIRPLNEKEVTTSVEQQKTTPFVFKASPVSPVPGVGIISMPKTVSSGTVVAVTSSGVSATTENVTCSSGSNAGILAFKFSDVSSTSTTVPTFSFTASKSPSTFSLRTDANSSGSIFGVPQTGALEAPPQMASSTVFSFVSNVSTTSSDLIFGSTSNLFPFSGSLSKSNSGNSIFSSSPSSEVISTAVVAPTTRSKSGTQSSVIASAKSGLILPSTPPSEGGSAVVTPADRVSSLKVTTGVAFATTATSNAPPTSTNAIISTVITTTTASTPVVTSSDTTAAVVPASAVTDDGTDYSQATTKPEIQIAEDGGQEVQETGKAEEVKNAVQVTDVSGVVASPTAVHVKTEAESNVTPSAFSSGATVFSPTTPPSGIFSMPTAPIGASGSIFGQSVSAAATTSNIFSTTAGNIFSPTKPVTTGSTLFSTPSSGSIFGQTAPTTASTGNIFGQVSSTTAASTFGQPAKDEVGQTAKLFGNVLGSNLSSRNIFSTPTSTTASGNIFGKSTFEKSSGNIFEKAAAATTATATPTGGSPGIFGTASSNIFSKGLVPQQQMPTSTSSGIFGQPQNADSGNTFFGQNICNTFGSSISASPNQNPFASASGFNRKPVFGQSLFGQTTTGQNPFERSQSSSIFGGSPSTTQNVFQSGSTSFGGLPPGPFSGGQTTTGQTGIGSASAFQKPIGGSIFGSPPSFTRSGAAPTFGGAPTFGAPATFGSPQKVFGSPQGTFGQNQANAPTFGALANQTDGFANLALQSQTQTPAFGGNTFTQSSNFGGDSNFGGTSFSSWRS